MQNRQLLPMSLKTHFYFLFDYLFLICFKKKNDNNEVVLINYYMYFFRFDMIFFLFSFLNSNGYFLFQIKTFSQHLTLSHWHLHLWRHLLIASSTCVNIIAELQHICATALILASLSSRLMLQMSTSIYNV